MDNIRRISHSELKDMKWWKVEVGVYTLAGAGQLILALMYVTDDDWLKSCTSVLFGLVLLIVASQTVRIEMLTKALTKSVNAHERHKDHAECDRREECSNGQ